MARDGNMHFRFPPFWIATIAILFGALILLISPNRHAPEGVAEKSHLSQLARQQGDAYQNCVLWEREGASWSAEKTVGGAHITVALRCSVPGCDVAGST